MQLLGCKRIAHVYEIFQDDFSYYMVSDVCTGGDFQLLTQRVKEAGVQVGEDWWRKIFKQCFRALEFMHHQAMMHCDIKEANLMLKDDRYAQPDVVLVDFGVTKAMWISSGNNRLCGTPGYIPPETYAGHPWYPAGDVFSLGVVIFQMLTGTTPPPDAKFAHETNGLFLEGCITMPDVVHATTYREPRFEMMPSEFPGLISLTSKVLEKDHRRRLRAPQALNDPWFSSPRKSVAFRPSAHRDSLPLEGYHRMATMGITEGDLPDFIRKIRAEEGRVQAFSVDTLSTPTVTLGHAEPLPKAVIEVSDKDYAGSPSTIALEESMHTATSPVEAEQLVQRTPQLQAGQWAAAATGVRVSSEVAMPVHPPWPCKTVVDMRWTPEEQKRPSELMAQSYMQQRGPESGAAKPPQQSECRVTYAASNLVSPSWQEVVSSYTTRMAECMPPTIPRQHSEGSLMTYKASPPKSYGSTRPGDQPQAMMGAVSARQRSQSAVTQRVQGASEEPMLCQAAWQHSTRGGVYTRVPAQRLHGTTPTDPQQCADQAVRRANPLYPSPIMPLRANHAMSPAVISRQPGSAYTGRSFTPPPVAFSSDRDQRREWHGNR